MPVKQACKGTARLTFPWDSPKITAIVAKVQNAKGNEHAMAARSLFEVHTLKGGQWIIDSTYSDRDSAIEVAKQLYGEKRFQGIKVIKDTFDAATGDGKEIVVFDTSKAPRDKAPPPPPTGKGDAALAAAGAAAPAGAPARGGRRASQKSSMNKDMSVAIKAIVMLAVILVVGAGLLYLVNQAGTLLD